MFNDTSWCNTHHSFVNIFIGGGCGRTDYLKNLEYPDQHRCLLWEQCFTIEM